LLPPSIIHVALVSFFAITHGITVSRMVTCSRTFRYDHGGRNLVDDPQAGNLDFDNILRGIFIFEEVPSQEHYWHRRYCHDCGFPNNLPSGRKFEEFRIFPILVSLVLFVRQRRNAVGCIVGPTSQPPNARTNHPKSTTPLPTPRPPLRLRLRLPGQQTGHRSFFPIRRNGEHSSV